MFWLCVAIVVGLAVGIPTAVIGVYAIRNSVDDTEMEQLTDGMASDHCKELLKEWKRLQSIDRDFSTRYAEHVQGGYHHTAKKILLHQRTHRELMKRVAKEINAAGADVLAPPAL